MVLGAGRLVQRAYATTSDATVHVGREHLAVFVKRAVAEKIRELTINSENAIIVINRPDLGIELYTDRPSSSRFMPIYTHGFWIAESYRGRVPQLILAFENPYELSEEEIAARFVDYEKDEWNTYQWEGWTFLEAGVGKE